MKQPNILLITSDQQHFSTLGCQNPHIKTPNLDRLAQRGTLFNRAYCPNPTCTPTRASLITGQFPSQHGAWSLGTKLSESAHTVGQDFQKAGYDATLIGKAHFQPLKGTETFPSLESYPTLQDLEFWKNFSEDFYGFNHVELARNHTDEAHVGQHYALWLEEKGCPNWKQYFSKPTGTSDPQLHTWNIPEEYHYNTWIAERTNARLEHCQNNDQPFFLWSSFFDPHPSYLVPEPWDKMYDPQSLPIPKITPGEHEKNPIHFQMTQEEKPDFSPWQEKDGNGTHGMHSHLGGQKNIEKDIAVYYGMVSMMDKYIGQILDKLDELNLTENTIIIFTSDHGHFFGQHGLVAKGPFHYEDVIKVPFIVSWPGHVQENIQSDALQSLVDIPVTALTLAGIPVPRTMTGVDQSPVWLGKQEKNRDQILVENRHQPTTIHLKTLVTDRYKCTVYYNREYGELFDLQEDPNEINNLWNDPASQNLKAKCIQDLLFAQMGQEPLWMPRIAPA